jgi:hypothetical protein
MTVHRHRFIGSTATALLLGAALATPALARQDAGPAVEREPTSASCPLTRVATQLVRCDNLTGNGVSAPLWIPQR